MTALSYEDVRWFDVPVNNALVVRRRKRIGDLDSDIERLVERQCFSRNATLQCLAIEKLHRNELLSILLINVVHSANVRMVQSRGGARLAPESLQRMPLAGKIFGQKFQRHETAKFHVFSLVDHTHAATT